MLSHDRSFYRNGRRKALPAIGIFNLASNPIEVSPERTSFFYLGDLLEEPPPELPPPDERDGDEGRALGVDLGELCLGLVEGLLLGELGLGLVDGLLLGELGLGLVDGLLLGKLCLGLVEGLLSGVLLGAVRALEGA